MSAAPSPTPLPHIAKGRKGPPIVLIHGFAADKESWGGFQSALARWRRTIAVDLPGHGEALEWTPDPNARACAEAICETLDALRINRAVLVGHSLGGAVAAIAGLLRPELVERLVLLAPGGFGTHMNSRLLHRYAAARDEVTLATLLEQFFSPETELPEGLAGAMAARRTDAEVKVHIAMASAITRGTGQGTLPLETLGDAPFSTTLVWGFDDAVLPVRQAIEAPASIARHLLPDVGHMPHLEAPELVLRIIGHTLGIRAAVE